MKKTLLTMFLALAGLSASAQEAGDMAVGFSLGAAPCLESGASLTNFGVGAKFRYNVTAPIRLEADVDYWLKSKEIDVLDISVNAHYIFKVNDKFNVYPMAGIGFAHIGGSFGVSYDFDGGDYGYGYGYGYGSRASSYYPDLEDMEFGSSTSTNELLINIGVGAEYAITDKVSVGAEIKYQYIKDFSRLPIKLGIAYKF